MWETYAFDSSLAHGSFESADAIFKKVFLLQGCGIAEDEGWPLPLEKLKVWGWAERKETYGTGARLSLMGI